MKYIIILLFFVPFLSKAQNALDSANGFKVFKLGSNISNNKSHVTAEIKKPDGSALWLIEDTGLLTVGNIKLSSGAVETFNDTIRLITFITDELNGIKMAEAFFLKYGFPYKENYSLYKGHEWETDKVNLHISGGKNGFIIMFKDIKYYKRKELEEKIINSDGL